MMYKTDPLNKEQTETWLINNGFTKINSDSERYKVIRAVNRRTGEDTVIYESTGKNEKGKPLITVLVFTTNENASTILCSVKNTQFQGVTDEVFRGWLETIEPDWNNPLNNFELDKVFTNEVWKPYNSRYMYKWEVSNYGRVRKLKLTSKETMEHRFIKTYKHKDKLSIRVSVGKDEYWYPLEKVMCMAFKGPPESSQPIKNIEDVQCEVVFLDGNQRNIKPDNLIWKTTQTVTDFVRVTDKTTGGFKFYDKLDNVFDDLDVPPLSVHEKLANEPPGKNIQITLEKYIMNIFTNHNPICKPLNSTSDRDVVKKIQTVWRPYPIQFLAAKNPRS